MSVIEDPRYTPTIKGDIAMAEYEGVEELLDDCPVVSAIAAIMAEVGSVSKDGTNKFHNYKFAAIADVVEKLQPLLAKHGLIPIQTEIEKAFIDDGRALSITYGIHLTHKSGAVLMTVNDEGDPVPLVIRQTGMASCRNSKDGFDDKAANKCHTAARKYALVALFQIPTVDADDADKDGDGAGSGGRRKVEASVVADPAPPPPVGPPLAIPMGKLTPMQWGAQFVNAIKQAKSDIERGDWVSLNVVTLEAIRAKAPLIYDRISVHLKPPVDDALVKTLGETFALCTTQKALDAVWRNGIADKGYAVPLLEAITAEFRKHEARIKSIN